MLLLDHAYELRCVRPTHVKLLGASACDQWVSVRRNQVWYGVVTHIKSDGIVLRISELGQSISVIDYTAFEFRNSCGIRQAVQIYWRAQ